MRTSLRQRIFVSVAFLAFLGLMGQSSIAFAGGPALTASAAASTVEEEPTGGLFTALQQRIYDSRTTTYAGNKGTMLAAGKWYPVSVAGVGGAPTSGISAVQVVLTEVNATATGNLKADKTGVATPNTVIPSLLWTTGKEANAATIPVGSDGKFQIYVTAATDIVIDLQGYYTSGATAGGGYVPGTPTKFYDSGTAVSAGQSVDIQVAGTNLVPAGASAVMLSILGDPTDTTAGSLRLYTAGSPPSTLSLLNWASTQSTIWTSAIGLSSNGKVTVAVRDGSIKLKISVQGYFTATDGESGAGSFTSIRSRVLDTRTDITLAGDETRTVQVAGIDGLPDSGTGLSAIAANLVIYPGTGSAAKGSVQLFADHAVQGSSAQVYYPDQKVSAFAVTTVGVDGGIQIHNTGTTPIDAVLDVEGWYQAMPLATPTISCPAPFADGATTAAVPTAPVDCTVIVNNTTYTPANGYLDIFVDGVELDAQSFSSLTSTTANVSLPPEGGIHSITATAVSAYGTEGTTTTYGFTIPGPGTPASMTADPWVNVPDPGNPDDPAATNFTPTLFATSNDAVTQSTTFEVRTSQDAASGSLIQTCTSSAVPSGGTASCRVQPLTPGTYYVRAQAADALYTSKWSDWFILPVSAIVNTEVLDPAVVTCPSISNGQWDLTPPTSSFTCQIVAPAASSGSGTLDVTLDGEGLPTVALQVDASTTTTVTIPAGPAGHDIQTSVTEVTDGPSTQSTSFSFGSGLWSNANLVPSISSGSESPVVGTSLWVTTDGAPFATGVTMTYTLASNPDGTGVISASSDSANAFDVPADLLTAGTTYYWKASVHGPTNYDDSNASLTSPWFSFVATDNDEDEDDAPTPAIESSAKAASSTPTRCGPAVLLLVRGTFSPADGSSSHTSANGFTYKNASQTGAPGKGDGYGNPADPEYRLVLAIRANNKDHIYTEGIKYPASAWFNSSVPKGRWALIGEMNSLAKACPHTKVFLSGHSQGAAVISAALSRPKLWGISARALANFSGAVLTGDPTYRSGEKIDAGGNGNRSGVWATNYRNKYTLDGYFGSDHTIHRTVRKIRSYCLPGDAYCQSSVGRPNALYIHNSYRLPATVNRLIVFIHALS